mgnify:CR=1 FL=1
MANKSVYQDFDADALTFFDLSGDSLYGVSAGSTFEEVLCTQDQTTYEKIENILTNPTEDAITFKSKKKAFILPRCGVSQDRLKSALKEHSITVTNDYELADLIIGHDDISIDRLQNSDNIPSTVMLSKLWNYETTEGSATSGNFMEARINAYSRPVIITSKVVEHVRYYNLDISSNLYDSWLLTGMAVNLAHLIETTDLSVIDTETVLHSSANLSILDEQLLSDLTSQLSKSGWSEDKTLAGKIIPTIDYKKNLHLLWQLSQDCSNIMYDFNREKDLQFWLKESNFETLSLKSAQQMILYLEKEEKLNKTYFRYLEPIVRKEITIHNRDLYTFKVAVKKEYQKYLKND